MRKPQQSPKNYCLNCGKPHPYDFSNYCCYQCEREHENKMRYIKGFKEVKEYGSNT